MKIQQLEEIIEVLESSDKFDNKTTISCIDERVRGIKICVSNDGWYLFNKKKLYKTGNTVIDTGITIQDLERVADAFTRRVTVETSFCELNCINPNFIYFETEENIYRWDADNDMMKVG